MVFVTGEGEDVRCRLGSVQTLNIDKANKGIFLLYRVFLSLVISFH